MLDGDDVSRAMGVDRYAALSGLEVITARPGYAEVRMPVAEKVRNGHGNLHGGALFTLADYAAAVASNLHGDATTAVNGSIAFLRAVRDGHVVARARTVKTGRRMNFMLVEIFDSGERLVATFQGSAMLVAKREPSP